MNSQSERSGWEREVRIQAGRATLPGTLATPPGTSAVVVFAHGSGSSRLSPRNRQVAGWLQEAGLGTLLFDLLTPDEAEDRANVFDIELMADRLGAATGWLREGSGLEPATGVGFFGASTGAAAALWAAAEAGDSVGAVVSRGGRPDLAGPRLGLVRAPTLLIVGALDLEVLELNRQALDRLTAEVELDVVPGATHLFEEPGTLEQAGDRATRWFVRWLSKAR